MIGALDRAVESVIYQDLELACMAIADGTVKPPGRPKPRWHQVDRQQRHDRQQQVDIGDHALWRGLHPGDDPDLAADAISQSRKRLPIGRAVVRGGGGLE